MSTYNQTIQVNVANGVSDSFDPPKGFVGNVFVYSGGNKQAAFLMGCDANGQFTSGGGFKKLEANSNASTGIDIEEVPIPPDNRLKKWKLTGAPNGATRIVFIGAFSS